MSSTADLRALLKEHGLLLKQGRELPSVVAHVAGAEVRGSWWSHPQGRAIFAALEELAEWRDALFTKLVLGKDTLVHRRLWPALVAVGTAREDWQTRELGRGARGLLERLERDGETPGAGEPGKELARALLCVSRQEHAQSGRHVTVLESWSHWTRRAKLRSAKMSAAEGRRKLEEAVTKLGAPLRVLPWARGR